MEVSTPSDTVTNRHHTTSQTLFEPTLFSELMLSSRRLSGSEYLVNVHKRSNGDLPEQSSMRPCQDTRGILGGSNAFQVSFLLDL